MLLLKKIANIDSQRKVLALITIFLLMMVGLFEFLPIVSEARKMFPTEFVGYSCYDIFKSRPWYGQINTWLWFWLLSTPITILLVKPDAPIWQKLCYVALIIAISYVVINLATHLGIKLWNAPFNHDEIIYSNGILQSSEKELFKYNCFNSADGARYVFALFYGWIPASLYVGFCFFLRWVFLKLFSKKAT